MKTGKAVGVLLLSAVLSIPVSAEAGWEFQESGVTVKLNDVCFIDELHGWAVGDNSTIIATTDGGETWEKQICPEPHLTLVKIEVNGNSGYCLSKNGPILKTHNAGKDWITCATSFNAMGYFGDLSFIDEKTGWIIGKDKEQRTKHVYFTCDGGDNWEKIYTFSNYIPAIAFINETSGWALNGAYMDNFDDSTVLATSDGGVTWEKISTINDTPNLLYAIPPDTLWAGWTGLYLSTDGGLSWDSFRDSHPRFFYPINGHQTYVLTWSNQFYHLKIIDGIEKSIRDLTSFAANHIVLNSMTAVGKYIWMVGSGGTIIRIEDIVSTGIDTISPSNFSLKQNSPNPFNSTTRIDFSISEQGYAKLLVYDINGRRVACLLSSEVSPGDYHVVWKGNNDVTDQPVSSGIYFYKLSLNGGTRTKKMLLLR